MTAATSFYFAPLRPRVRMRLPLLPAAATSILLLAASGVHRAGAFTFNAVPETEMMTAFSSYITTNSVNLNDSSASAITSLEDALAYAVGGDTIHLANGTYLQRIESTVSGEEGNPITIVGGRDAVIQSNSPLVEITHSWITLQVRSCHGIHACAGILPFYSSVSIVLIVVIVAVLKANRDMIKTVYSVLKDFKFRPTMFSHY